MFRFSKQNKRLFILGAVCLILAVTFSYALTQAEAKNPETKTKEINISEFNPSQAKNNLITNVNELKANYFKNQNYEWQSEVIKTDFAFDALGAQWRKDEESNIKISVRFSKDNKTWEDWQEVVIDDADQGNEKSESAQTRSFEISDLAFSSQAQYFQYKVGFQDKIDQAYLESINFTYINSSDNSTTKTLSSLFKIKKAQAVNSPRVISRAEWGANPAYMTWGPEYVRPNKIIIHHTASGNNPPDPAAVMRSIYYYHAVSLGWGDIGYNYLFDQHGNIYEGRAGGNMAVGAHAYGQNYGSVGFSVIGEFTSVNITPATFNALTDLTAFKAYENDFDINWGTIFGHRDFCNNPPGHNCTACPGNVLYSRKGEIIDNARAKIETYLQRDRDFLNQNNNVLVKSYSRAVVYLWQDGKKRPILDVKTFALFNYSWADINYLSSMALDEKPEGEKISALAKLADSPAVYLLAKNPDIRYTIPSIQTFDNFGFNWNNVAEISATELNSFADRGILSQIIKTNDSPTVYYISQNRKDFLANSLALEGWGLDKIEIPIFNKSFLETFNPGRPLYNLVRVDGQPTVYLLSRGQKSVVPNIEMFDLYMFNWNEITLISQNELGLFPQAQNVGRYVKGDAVAVYLIDQGKKFPFPNTEMFTHWGRNFDNILMVNDLLLMRFSDGEAVGNLIKDFNSPAVYLVYGGKKYPFASVSAFNSWGKNWQNIQIFSNNIISDLGLGTTLHNFVQKTQDPTVYLMISGEKRIVPNPLALILWGGSSGNISQIPEELLDSLPESTPINYLIKGSGVTVYLMDNGKKNTIPSLEVFNAWGFNDEDVSILPDQLIAQIPDGNSLGLIIRPNNSPSVYQVEDGHKAAFPSGDIFLSWGYNWNQINVVDPLVLTLLSDSPSLSIFARHTNEEPEVYLLNSYDKKLFSDAATLEAYGGSSKVVISKYIDRLATTDGLTLLAKGPGPAIYYLLEGEKCPFPDWATFVAFGFNMNQVTLLSQTTINALSTGDPVSRLIKGSGPAIYVLEASKKRPVPNWDVFVSWGWTSTEVKTFNDNFINSIPLGPMIIPQAPELVVTANGPYRVITTTGIVLANYNNGTQTRTNYYNGQYYLLGGNDLSLEWFGGQGIRFEPTANETIMEIMTYSDPNYNGSVNYNRFRGSIEIAHSGSGTWAVNDLSLNDYTAGICEAPSGHPEYLKTMAVAARSYGLWHLSRGGKYLGEPFHLKNSRRGNGNDQVYCGFGFEAIASSYAPQARATDNQAVLYGGNPILAAYSHGSYPRTKSALETWGTDYPYLQSVPDPYGDPARPCGTGGNHCVGLSASGAIGFAQNENRSYDWILGHYYSGTAIGAIPNQNIRIAIYSF